MSLNDKERRLRFNMSLNDKERRLIPESDGESFYWKKEKDVKEFIKKEREAIDMFLRGEITVDGLLLRLDKLAEEDLI